MKPMDRRWMRWIELAALSAATLASAAIPSCGGSENTGGGGGAGGSGAWSSHQSSSSSSQSSSSSSSQSSGSSSSQSGSSSGPPPCPLAADKCPGAPHSLSRATPLTTTGWTPLCSADYQGYCGIGPGGSGADAVYELSLVEAGTMLVTLDTPGWYGVVYAYAPGWCNEPKKVIACKDLKWGATKFALEGTTGEVYSIVVDGRDGASGFFTLKVELGDPACGDGIIDQGEDCDFGKVGSPEDGCDITCHFSHDPMDTATDACPTISWPVTAGKPLTIPGPDTLQGDIYTSGYKDTYQPCGAMGGGPDRVFGFSLASAGTLTVDVTADFDVVIAAYTTCTAALDGLLACSDGAFPNAAEHLSLSGPAGATFYVVVDGYDATSFGSFKLTATLN